jgi:virginiamycin B lyase
MRTSILCTLAIGILAADVCIATHAVHAQSVSIREWPVEWQGRPRDPDLDAQGRVWFVGQTGNYIGVFDPRNESWRRYELEPRTLPHNLVIAPDGGVWYAGNGNGRIGRLDPESGQTRIIRMPNEEARDPHTLLQDGKGNIWFTVQQGGFVGRLNMASGQVDLISTGDETRPYGVAFDSRGHVWFNLFGTHRVAVVDPASLQLRELATPRADSRNRRIAVTADDAIWYTDFAGGYIGRIDPRSGAVREFLAPGGERSQPYALLVDDRNQLWYSECARNASFLVGFDPATEKVTERVPVSACIRHMVFHQPTRSIWFGTDANNIGRATLP